MSLQVISPPWGKLGADGTEQPLSAHCRDVAAVFVALLRLPGIRARLARLAGVATFHDIWIERLGWFAFLHDVGKVNAGFQARRDPTAPMIGHVLPILGDYDRDRVGTVIGERIDGWGDAGALTDWFHAVLSHHGKPWVANPDHPDDTLVKKYRHCWNDQGAYSPTRELARLRDAADAMFPGAFETGAPLPLSNPLIHALAGFVMLADWIASSDWRNSPTPDQLDHWASAWLRHIGLDPSPQRMALAARAPTFEAAFSFRPSPAQSAFAMAEAPLVILESETGSGKTEAALWRFVTRFRRGKVDGLYFALPTRTAAAQLWRRVDRLAKTLWPDAPPPVVLAVPGYLDDDRKGALPDARDEIDRAEEDARAAPAWAAEHPKRYFTGMIAVGTIDQVLLAALRTKHAHMRGAALMRLMLVIDEVHASDRYMSALTEDLLADHLAAGGEAALLSATLGARARTRYGSIGCCDNLANTASSIPPLAAAIAAPYPAITGNDRIGGVVTGIAASGRTKAVHMSVAPILDDAEAIAAEALSAATQGAKVLVVRNTVTGAIAVQEALERQTGRDSALLFRVEGVVTLHHGRFAREDRLLLDNAVEAAVGKARPPGGRVIVGTQTLEQSLDIDADVLITDLCPIDVLLQRLGRLHRHDKEPGGLLDRGRPSAYRQARALVLAPSDDLSTLLSGPRRGRDAHGLGPMRDGTGVPRGVYPDLIALELTRRLCLDDPVWSIPAMNRRLVERTLHADARDAFIATAPDALRPLWRKHRGDIDGVGHGDLVTGHMSALDRRKPFMHGDNGIGPEDRFATRLGDSSLLLDLPDGTIGPFGKPIRRLAIPAWWRPDHEAAVEHMRVQGGEIQFELSTLRLSYGRQGLRRSEP
jgi:CRISPR-associated endonuclease/helicase Cas3